MLAVDLQECSLQQALVVNNKNSRCCWHRSRSNVVVLHPAGALSVDLQGCSPQHPLW